MAKTTETVLDTTPNKKWDLMSVERETCSQSALSFKITNGTKSDCPVVKRLDRRRWTVTYDSPQLIPKYVRLFVAKYFRHWFYPMELPS